MNKASRAGEYNFDGLPGPTHHFAGLAWGNKASMESRYASSSPKKAALASVAKMRLALKLGLRQGIIPPQERPAMNFLRTSGYRGEDADILKECWQKDKELLLSAMSASSMWVANAATVSPSSDTQDGKVHMTPANLISQKHRRIEAEENYRFLEMIFNDRHCFRIHKPLEEDAKYADEGAANHMRLAGEYSKRGVSVFVYGKRANEGVQTEVFSPRQSFEASKALADSHGLCAGEVVFVKQNPTAIDEGVFHNDVIALSNENVLITHELAYENQQEFFREIKKKFRQVCNEDLYLITVSNQDLPLAEAVATYFFNSQLVSLKDGTMHLLMPLECRGSAGISRLIDSIVQGKSPVAGYSFIDLSESMRNGGGPACLRLRVVLTDREARAVNGRFVVDERKLDLIEEWIRGFYRGHIDIDDLTTADLLQETRAAYAKLTEILDWGAIYSFQKNN